MDFTILCPGCGSRLKLFDRQVKTRKGVIRCTRCGQKIPYDLDNPDPVRTGFWADTETPFKPGAQNRFLSIAKARQKKTAEPLSPPLAAAMQETASPSSAPRIPPAFDRSQSRFQKFDLKTGTIVPAGQTPEKTPAAPKASPAAETSSPQAPASRSASGRRPSPNLPRTDKAAARARLHTHPPMRPASPPRQTGQRSAPAGIGIFQRVRTFFSRWFRPGK